MTAPTATQAPSQYLIRSFEFAYNDEYYDIDGELGRIQAVFDTAALAQAELDRLIIQRLRAEDALHGYEPFFEPSEEFAERVNTFCIKRCGQPVMDEEGFAYELPKGLTDADVLEFAQLTGLLHYQLIEVPADGVFVALWLVQQKTYACGYAGNMWYQPSLEALMDDVSEYRLYTVKYAFPESWTGSYDDLSDSPMLLRQFVSTRLDLVYDENKKTLSFAGSGPLSWNGPDLFALNALLKQPVFEVRKLTVPELLD